MKTATPKLVARLVPVRIEGRAHGRAFQWIEGFKVINPEGRELQPYMRKREARSFCKQQGWAIEVQSIDAEPQPEPTYTVTTWEERDRLHINLSGTDGTDLDWWDDDARQMFDDGFFEAKRLEESVIEYAREHGLLGAKS